MTTEVSTVRVQVTDRNGAIATVECPTRQSLMRALKDKGYALQAICGGAMSCATCHVFIDAAWRERLPERKAFEQALLEDTDAFDADASRLACQIELDAELDGLVLVLAPEE